MLDKFVYEGLHFIMKWAGTLNSWAWRKHVKILENRRIKEDEDETSRKLNFIKTKNMEFFVRDNLK